MAKSRLSSPGDPEFLSVTDLRAAFESFEAADSLRLEKAGRYPTTLDAALDALEQDEVLMDALGSDLSRSYLAVKRSEYAAFANEDLEFEIKHHIHKF